MRVRQDRNSFDWAVYVCTRLSCLKYNLRCTYIEYEPAPDKTYNKYNTRMYVRPAKTQVSLCIDPLYKASFLDSPESTDGAYCMIIEGSDPRGRGSYIWHSMDVRAE